ncbi:MAG: DUF1540 domain-containing protein [Dehalococcoidales bacterium]|nr:DUF1540 domain-containing protein [Dehalococcoidales bacterium]
MATMNMSGIASCNMSSCAFNSGKKCRTMGISVGHHAECKTFAHASAKSGYKEVVGGVGACQASDCKFNDMLECTADNIDVASHDMHADCIKFCMK